MSSILSIATSGMTAASTRLDVAASNIANSLTDGPLPTATPTTTGGANTPNPYTPLAFNQVDMTSGAQPSGTFGTVSPVSPSFVPAYDPTSSFANQSGFVAEPNVDLVNETMQLAISKYAFTANAKVAQTEAQMTKSLLDVLS